MHHVCVHKKFAGERIKVVPRAKGAVVEFGMGSGLNIPFYDAAKVRSVIGIDPSSKLLEKAAERIEAVPFAVEAVTGSAEDLPMGDNYADTVISTFTLCTIPDLIRVFEEARRVLKPGGELLFCEHGLSSDASVARWQNRFNPIWKPLAGGCHLNRNIPELIRSSGFEITEMETGYMEGAPGIGGFLYRGAAKVR